MSKAIVFSVIEGIIFFAMFALIDFCFNINLKIWQMLAIGVAIRWMVICAANSPKKAGNYE